MVAHQFRMFAALGCAGWLTVLFYGCSGESHVARGTSASTMGANWAEPVLAPPYTSAEMPVPVLGESSIRPPASVAEPTAVAPGAVARGGPGRSCSADADCSSGFCDRGFCVELAGKSNYGAICDSQPMAGTPQAGQPDPQCGGYLCLEGRCRSCTTSADCRQYFGAGDCSSLVGRPSLPGTVCWPMAEKFYIPRLEWIGKHICANVGPNIAVQQRAAAGKACVRDCDCRSGFCDRGTCADSKDIGAWYYGKGGCHPGPPHAPIDVEVGSQANNDDCEGYLCVDHRCRSCVSDAECQAGRKEYRCLRLYDLPGKRCGWPGEATLGPAPDRMGSPRRRRPPDWCPEQ